MHVRTIRKFSQRRRVSKSVPRPDKCSGSISSSIRKIKHMAKVTQPHTEQEDTNIQGEQSIDNKLEMLKFTATVQSRIRKDISEDFVLAKLGAQDKEGVIEMTTNAYFMKKIMHQIRTRGNWRWEWDKTKQTWHKKQKQPKELEYMRSIENKTFDSYMTRIYMTVILNRNVKENWLINILSESKTAETGTVLNDEDAETREKIKELMKREPTE